MRPRPIAGLLLVATACVLGNGCRCGPSEDELPATRPPPAPSAAPVGACPARPAWAATLAPSSEVEVLHISERAAEPHGTGYRLHDDGRFETYDDVEVKADDAGRMVFKKVDGAWRERGRVTEEALAEVRKTVREMDALTVRGLQTTKVTGGKAFTLVTVRRDGATTESCYYGQQAASGLEPLQKKMHDLVNRSSR